MSQEVEEDEAVSLTAVNFYEINKLRVIPRSNWSTRTEESISLNCKGDKLSVKWGREEGR